jgi:uncharacterized protein
MKIDLKELRTNGKIESNFCFQYSPESLTVDVPDALITMPIMVTGKITLTDRHSAYIEGEICYTIEGSCTRCLGPAKKEFLVSFSEHVEQNNPDGYSVVNDSVDLAKIVDDEIILNTPVEFLCEEDCKGICLGCMVNLNEDTCKCKN